MNDRELLVALRHDLATLPRAEKLREVIVKVMIRAFGGHYDYRTGEWVYDGPCLTYAKIRRNEGDRGQTLSRREQGGGIEDFKPRRRGIISSVRLRDSASPIRPGASRRQAKKLIGNRDGLREGPNYGRQWALERETESEFRAEVRDLDLHLAIEALNLYEYQSFVDYLGRGMSEARALAKVRAEVAEREKEWGDESMDLDQFDCSWDEEECEEERSSEEDCDDDFDDFSDSDEWELTEEERQRAVEALKWEIRDAQRQLEAAKANIAFAKQLYNLAN